MTDEELEAILGDDNDDEPYKHWRLRAKISTTTRRTRNGADVSNNKPAVNPKLGLDYDFTSDKALTCCFTKCKAAGIHGRGRGISFYMF